MDILLRQYSGLPGRHTVARQRRILTSLPSRSRDVAGNAIRDHRRCKMAVSPISREERFAATVRIEMNRRRDPFCPGRKDRRQRVLSAYTDRHI